MSFVDEILTSTALGVIVMGVIAGLLVEYIRKKL